MLRIRTRMLLLLICTTIMLRSQNSDDSPKVGLALSGGAAHGFAHIGVLKYFEEIGLQIDYITGTSMGSIIGGMYAMGYSADEIAIIAGQQDWALLMSNRSPLWEVAPIEKETHEKIPLSVVWKNKALRFPQGLIQGQKLDLIISKIYSSAYLIDDFDDFHIPFRCLAVDIVDGSIDVLDSGFIGEAIRASMAIPTVFPPKEIDGTLYVDGGLLRNYPVQEVIDMGADIAIGVYVGGVKAEKDKLYSAFDIFKQSTWMASILDSEEQERLLDVNIRPDVKDIGSFDFENYQEIIELGYRKARENEDALRAIVENKRISIRDNQKLKKINTLRFNKILTTHTDIAFNKMIVNKLNFRTNEDITFSKLEESLSLVFGTKNFSKTSYDFDFKNDGIALVVNTEEVDPFYLGVSLNRFKYYNASIILSAELRNKIGKPSSLRADFRISENPGIQAHYHHRLPSNPSYLLSVVGQYETNRTPFFDNDIVDRLYRNDNASVELGVDKEWKNKYLFRFHYFFQYDKLRPIVFKENDIKIYSTQKQGLKADLTYNTLDRNIFPESGTKLDVSSSLILKNNLNRENQTIEADFITINESASYINLDFDIRHYERLGHFSAELFARGRLSSGQSLLDSYKIGGPFQDKNLVYGFIGADDSELIIGDHISTKIGLRYNINNRINIVPQVQYLYGVNYLSYAFDISKNISKFGYGLGIGINSPIGPIYIDVGIARASNKVVSNIGFGFRHLL